MSDRDERDQNHEDPPHEGDAVEGGDKDKKESLPEVVLSSTETINTLFSKLGKTLADTDRFFSLRGALVFIDTVIGLVYITARTFNAHCANFCAFVVGDDDAKQYTLLQQSRVNAFVHSAERIRSSLPALERYTRIPCFSQDFELIAEPGYHKDSKTYYDGPEITPADDFATLREALSTFLWKDKTIDMINFVGLLLTAITATHWPGLHPLAVFDGNRPGVGKSLLAKILGVIVDGESAKSISYNPNDEEFEKQIATRVKAGDNVILIDNAKRTKKAREVSSPVLERSVTDHPDVHYRLLGFNMSIMRPNTMIFCLTMNSTRLSPDLARRALPINLHSDTDVRQQVFDIPDMLEFVKQNRGILIAELLGMVDRWAKAGKPIPNEPAKHSVSQRWAETIDAILQHNGLLGFLSNLDEAAFDPDYGVVQDICAELHEKGAMSPSEWAKLLVDSVLKPSLTVDGVPKSDRAQATIVGQLFKRFVGTVFVVDDKSFVLNSSEPGKGHQSKQYGFHQVDTPNSTAGGQNE